MKRNRSPSGAPNHLRCEYFENPLGLDEPRPRLLWWVNDPRRGARQTAYQVLAMNGDGSVLWDSGKVVSDRSVHVEYRGPALPSRQRVTWKVRTWLAGGRASAWSVSAHWEMGLLDRADWKGKWIGSNLAGGPRSQVPCPYLRREFSLGRRVASARLYVTALGLYECWLNGRRVGEDVLRPGWTDYRKRVPYQVYDVTKLLRPGDNALGAILGDGWYCGYLGWFGRQHYGDRPKLLAQLEVRFADGTGAVVATDGSWKWNTGAILESDLYMGESHDARRERSGWDRAGYDERGWSPVVVFEEPGPALVAQAAPPVRRIEELRPVAAPVARPGSRWIYDLGQNMVGRVRLKLRGGAGKTVRLRHAEMLQANGDLYTENLRSARATDLYTFKTGGVETWEPKFTFHGFRYVELEGCPETPSRDAITGLVLHSATPPTGAFACSNPRVNQLQSNIRWGQKGNFLEVPTDCPQRDERLGWTGDAQVFVRTAAFNMDVAGFFTKWQQDLADAQSKPGEFPKVAPDVIDQKKGDGGPAWADAGVICPWTMYLCYGDLRLLERHYDSLARFIANLEKSSRGLIRAHEDFQGFHGFGDWLAIDEVTPGASPTPKSLIGTAYFARCAGRMARIAGFLGKPDDARRYARLEERVKAAFNREFVSPAGRIVGNTQTGYLLALGFDLLPVGKRRAALKQLVDDLRRRDWHLSTGFVGTPLLAPVLTRFGRADVAYCLLLQDTWPGWLYTVKQGATTMWERWNSWTKEKGFGPVDMNSFNHYAYGAIGEWLYATVAGLGLDPSRPGYKRLVIRPEPGGGLTWAKAELKSVHGPIRSSWKLARGKFVLELLVPANTTASVTLPSREPGRVTEGGKPLTRSKGIGRVRKTTKGVTFEVGAGVYVFQAPAPAR